MKLPARLRWRLRHLGVRRTIEERLALLEDRLFDSRNRTDTYGVVELKALSIASPTKHLGHLYAPSCVRALRRFLMTCAFPPGSVLVDLGCGKGRALLVASHFPFKRVVGVEFARELCRIAASNVQVYRQRHRGIAPIEVIEADAAEYEIRPDENVFYMFSPFQGQVVHQVVRNIGTSVARHDRPVWIVYNTPSHAEAIESSGMFAYLRTFRYGLDRFAVYASRRALSWPKTDDRRGTCRFGPA